MIDRPVFVILDLPSLQLRIVTEGDEIELTRMMGDEETLDALLDLAVDGAAYDGNWAGLVLLRDRLLKYADEAQSALKQIAAQGPYKDLPQNKQVNNG